MKKARVVRFKQFLVYFFIYIYVYCLELILGFGLGEVLGFLDTEVVGMGEVIWGSMVRGMRGPGLGVRRWVLCVGGGNRVVGKRVVGKVCGQRTSLIRID